MGNVSDKKKKKTIWNSVLKANLNLMSNEVL